MYLHIKENKISKFFWDRKKDAYSDKENSKRNETKDAEIYRKQKEWTKETNLKGVVGNL